MTPVPAAVLRLLTYNLRDLLDDRDAVAHVVRSLRPDVACLQEVPRRPLTGHRVRRLVRETGLRRSAGGRGSGGTAVLTSPRVDVLGSAVGRLPVAGALTRTRGYALARVRLDGGRPLTAVSVHLPLRPAERLTHLGTVLGLLGPDAAAVVAGDLNEPPDGPAWSLCTPLLRDAVLDLDDPVPGAVATYPARAPRSRIDAVLVSQRVQVRRVTVVREAPGVTAADLRAASDHLPVLAELIVLG